MSGEEEPSKVSEEEEETKGEVKEAEEEEEERLVEEPCTAEGVRNTKLARVAALDPEALPISYRSNSRKEEICVEYVEDFDRKFRDLFPDRRRLFLLPPNEFGVRKFVCTTLRPTQMNIHETYRLGPCAEFVANYMEYEPLEDTRAPPPVMPSPKTVLQWRIGDCFDFSVVLCSYLLGLGYDAYCVIGYAPRWICLRDQSACPCPLLAQDAETGEDSGPEGAQRAQQSRRGGGSRASSRGRAAADEDASGRYVTRPRGVPDSKFMADVERRHKEEQERRRKEEEEDTDEEEEKEEEEDPLAGERLHCWVLVLPGRRDVEAASFIEPSTGVSYPVPEAPYLGVEAVFSHQNYWVNMQEPECGARGLEFDFANSDNWEFVFLDNLGTRARTGADGGGAADGADELGALGTPLGGDTGSDARSNAGGSSPRAGESAASASAAAAPVASGGEGDNGGEGDDLGVVEGVEVLDLPPSWVERLTLPRDEFRTRYMGAGGLEGGKTVLYRKAKLERFARHMHREGLLMRLTTYRDTARTIPVEIREEFGARTDKLIRRVRRPLERRLHESFDAGRPNQLKEFIEVTGVMRELCFYRTARPDGLKRRCEHIGVKLLEEFEDRDDRLTYRSLTLDREGVPRKEAVLLIRINGEDKAVRKMAEKFSRDPEKDADEDYAKLTYHVLPRVEARVAVRHQLGPGRITASWREFAKDGNTAPVVVFVDETKPRPWDSVLEDELEALMVREKALHTAMRNAVLHSEEVMELRARDEAAVALEKTVFELAMERVDTDAHKEEEEEDEEAEDEREKDFLAPFLGGVRDPRNMTREEAQSVRDACLDALKQRLLERANIIQRRLDEENARLTKRQTAYHRTREHDEGAEEEFERFCQDAMFKINILDQRLQEHEQTALKKFAELNQKLSQHPLLQVLASS